MIARVWEAQISAERRFAAADSLASVTIAHGFDVHAGLGSWRANALLGMGQAAEAVALLEPRVGGALGREARRGARRAGVRVRARRPTGEARALLENMRARSGGRLPATGAVAATLEELGDHEAAVAIFGEADRAARRLGGAVPLAVSYDRLRKDPRVAALLDRLGGRRQ